MNIGATGRIDGEANTALAVAADSDTGVGGVQLHQAVQYCTDLDIHGKQDWYLPSDSESKTMQMYYTAIGDFGGASIWTSSEYSNSSQAFLMSASAFGSNGLNNKDQLESVRCVRK